MTEGGTLSVTFTAVAVLVVGAATWLVGPATADPPFSSLAGVPRRQDPDPRSAAGVLRTAALFAAVVLLVVILAGPTSLTVG